MRWPCAASAVLAIALVPVLPAHAQDRQHSPRAELFGGYSYLPQLDEYAIGEAGHGWTVALSVNLRRYWGVVVDVDGHTWTNPGNLNSVDFTRLQCPLDGFGCGFAGDEGVSLRYFSVGPRVRVRTGRLTTFGLVVLEVQRSRYSEQDFAYVGRADDGDFIRRFSTRPENYSSNRPMIYNTWDRPLERYGDNVVARSRIGEGSNGAWGVGIGGGADVPLGRVIAIRLAQVNYSFGGFGGGPGRKLRIKTGIVFKVG